MFVYPLITLGFINYFCNYPAYAQWNTDETDSTDLHGFLTQAKFKSVIIRLIRVILVPFFYVLNSYLLFKHEFFKPALSQNQAITSLIVHCFSVKI